MAPSAVSATPEAALDSVNKPPSDVVVPPREIRAILEKTAGYVARNGVAFEDRIRQKEIANPKFSFLNQNDAYSAYYLWRLDEIRAGRGTTVSAGPIGESAARVEEKPKGPEPPPEFHFSARMPNINAQDLDVVRLTALWVAKNGRSFMTTLSQKEATNYQFDFLRPQHSLFQFFNRLVDQYTELLNARGADGGKAEQARIADLTRNVKNKFHILDRAKQRSEWVRFQEQQKQKKEEEAEAEKLAYAQVDWHDFVIVETVLFTEADDEAELPPPTSLNDLQSASLEQKAMMSLAPHNMRIEEAMPTDVDMPYHDPYQQQQQQYMPQQLAHPSFPQPPQFAIHPAPSPAPQAPTFTPPPQQQAPTRPPSTSHPSTTPNPTNPPMKIRSDYIPRAQRAAPTVATLICPNCKQPVPVAELDAHMKIELLDPRWREQRAKAESRYATTNLSTADVASNLKRLASQRTDVFDADASGGVGGGEGEGRERKRVAMVAGYDSSMMAGSAASSSSASMPVPTATAMPMAPGQTVNIEEQLRRIQEKAAGRNG